MEQLLVIITALGGGSFLGWLASTLIAGGEYKNRIKKLEDVAHPTPCSDINNLKVMIERIETNVEWLVKRNGGWK